MIVFGCDATILQETGQHVDVNGFAEECQVLEKLPIVDAAVAYDCPYSLKTFILVGRNAICVPSMTHNLVPPFIMREAGLEVNDIPKIHVDQPTKCHHSIFCAETDLRIPLKLRGVFSYFPTRRLTHQELQDEDFHDIIFLSPDAPAWDPHLPHWADMEDSFLDHEGEIVGKPEREDHHLVQDDDMCISSLSVTVADVERAVNACVSSAYLAAPPDPEPPPDELDSTILEDPIRANVCSIDAKYDERLCAHAMAQRMEFSKMAVALGSVHCADSDSDCELFGCPKSPSISSISIGSTCAGKGRGVTAEHLSKVWKIPHQMAQNTIDVTTQLNRRGANTSLARNLGTNDRMLRYRRIASWFFTDTFFVTAKAKSTRGFTMMQLFVSDKGFVKVYPMKSTSDYPKALKLFAKDVGAPEVLVADPHRAQTSKEVKDFCNQIGTVLRILEQSTQFANRAELYIGLLKNAIRLDMRETHSPLVLWDYCAERRADIFTLTARDLFQLNGTNPYTATFGEEGDISALCQFDWYQWVYFYDDSSVAQFPFPKALLGRCLGPAKNEGNEMTMWVLKQNGKVVPRRTLKALTAEQMAPSNEVEAQKRADFDASIREKLGDSFTLPPNGMPPPDEIVDTSFDSSDFFSPSVEDSATALDDGESPRSVPVADITDAHGKPIYPDSATDLLIQSEVRLPQGESMQLAKVLRRSVDSEGRVIGEWNDNPFLNTLVYDVEFPDGELRKYGANVIAQNVLSQCDEDGFYTNSLKSIITHSREGNAVRMADKYIVTKSGQKRLRKTTIGWKFLVEYTDGSRAWRDLKDLKEEFPVDVAEYVSARGLVSEPAFQWWVPYTLRKRDVIVSAMQSRVRKKSQKYGIEIPTSIKHAAELDRRNGNTFWMDAIKKEMADVGIAFELLDDGAKPPPGWTKSSGHIIFDVKMDFTRKARWVKDGHKSPTPETSAYAGVVSRESVRVALTYAALMGLDVMCADVQNAFLQAPSSEKHYIVCGPEFGLENVGKIALIKRALYGGKVAGRDFWHHLRSYMQHLGFDYSKADPDVWRRPATMDDGTEYYEYVLLYCDDILVISHRAELVLRNEMGKDFKLKEKSIGKPDQYLGGKLREVEMENGQKCWAFGSAQYVKAAVDNVESYLQKRGGKLQPRTPTPLSSNYRPELDITEELDEEQASYYHSLIGVLRWMVELGRADICVEVSMMSSHLALPRAGHLKELFHIFAYLKCHHNAEMVFDPTAVELDMSLFKREDWRYSIYTQDGEVLKEILPPDMPKPRGKGMQMRVYVDADHAGDQVTRRSRSGFVVFLNSAPIYWSSKKQGSCETSTYGSELVAMKQAAEYTRGLRYKLRMMGLHVDEPSFIFGDNQSVLANTTKPESMIKKKSNSIAYHYVREGVARDEWRTTYILTHDNVADLMTKPLPSGEKRWKFVRMLLHHL